MGYLANVKEAVRRRDGYRCVNCGMTNADHIAQTGRQLEVHRINPGSPYEVIGCVTLCRTCHGPQPRSVRSKSVPKLTHDQWRMLRVVCAWKLVKADKWLAELILPHIEREYELMKAEVVQGLPPSPKK